MTKILLINPNEKFSHVDLQQWIFTHPNHELTMVEKEGIVEADVIAAYPDTEILLCT